MNMEIERIVSGDLNKNIEQCVSILMDVERRVSALKTELTQTMSQLPGTPGTPNIGLGTYGPRAALPGLTPLAAPVQGLPQGAVVVPWFVGNPQNILGLYQAPTPFTGAGTPAYGPAYAPAHAPSYAPGNPSYFAGNVLPNTLQAPVVGVPVHGVFAPNAVSNFGYIW